MRPGSEFAMTEEELTKVAGFSKDIEGSRREARRLLREAGVPEGFSFKILNRSEGDYEVAGVWLIDQWSQIGLDVKQEFQELGLYMKTMRTGNYELALESISESLEEPSLLLARVVSSDRNPDNHGRYVDRALDDLYEKQSRAINPVERKQLIRKFEIRLIDEMAYTFPVLWNLRIVAHSAKLKGWNIMPHHSLNVDLANVWLSED
jgi:peptide/nickel transport system substrate-binding protein